MLPIRTLDNERFADISQGAREMISNLYPQWTDFNYHDPGITFIELFAWLKEIQQYHMDQIGRANLLKFLKLLGVEQSPKQPATACVRIHHAAQDGVLPQGTQLLAGDVVFETCRSEPVTAAAIVNGYSVCGSERINFGSQLAFDSARLHIHPFGKNPSPGDQLYIALDRPLPENTECCIWLDIFGDYPVLRNPVRDPDSFVPLARLLWEYYDGDGWRELTIHRDDTHQMIVRGGIRISLDRDMGRLPQQEGFWIRVTVVECGYDVSPILCGICINMIETRQQETLSVFQDFALISDFPLQTFAFCHDLARRGHCDAYGLWEDVWHPLKRPVRVDGPSEEDVFLFQVTVPAQCRMGEGRVRLVWYDEEFSVARMVGKGDGFPSQQFELDETGLLGSGFTLMVDAYGDGHYTEWEQVTDFDASTPVDRHYIFDEGSGRIEFGTAERGMAPEGQILIIACSRCLGRDGNVKEGRIDRFVRSDIAARATNPDNAWGGQDRESLEAGFLRAREELRKVERAVTYEDYETLIMETPGLMIRNCKAIPVSKIPRRDGSVDENCVSVVVQPYTDDKVEKLSRAYMENIHLHIQDRRLLGTRINLLSPEYIGIEIFCEALVKPYYPEARERIERAIKDFFNASVWEFGRPVLYSTIYGIIDSLDCVGGIQSLSIDAQGKGILRSVNGDVLLPQNGMAYLKAAQYMLSAAE